MPAQDDIAFVLRLSDYSETSQIATLFARGAGLLRLIAKGARRSTRTRFATGLDLLELGDLGYTPAKPDAGLGMLTEWKQRDTFSALRTKLVCQYGGFYAAELIAHLTQEYDPHPDLFDALHELLRRLAGETPDPLPADYKHLDPPGTIVRFQGALLRAIGFSPTLRRCVDCGHPRVRNRRAFFSSHAGGMICPDCESRHTEKRRLSPLMLDAPPEAQKAPEWFDLLDYHLTHIAGRALRTSKPLRAQIEQWPADC